MISDLDAADVTIQYEGILPDLFREGQGVVTKGVLTEEGVLVAEEVLAKHDENYMPPEVADALKEAHGGEMPVKPLEPATTGQRVSLDDLQRGPGG